ncbi:alpha/beta hydrolase [Palleronia abyssalis]|uniref:Thermostable monoacylglycerol lipase n=1 Tax=Palleronia abyssalis TaxID=1501240 RepID=A0A2R8BYV9_9RHOB|nr:alpha/beta fold hydrolase [Palleronia abyssalis]SPJ25322.1 Thermostable monoacylglycerol lipase [Palleronia abyssalis]
MRLTLAVVMAVVGLSALFLAIVPGARMGDLPDLAGIDLGADLSTWLNARESFDDIVDGAEARVEWAGDEGTPTQWGIVYLHGFSGTSEEIRPVPERVAEALGANVFYTRFTGHGRDGADMALASAEAWARDTSEAVAVGQRIASRVLVIGTSTGGTMAAIAAADRATADAVDAVVMISPNFGPQNPMTPLLTWPAASVPLIAGETRGFDPENELHARYWTEAYPTIATIPMQAAVDRAKQAELENIVAPALFIYSPDDKVVRPAATKNAIDAWGGPVEVMTVAAGEGVDPSNHVLAGDILSPTMTDPVVQRILTWVRSLPE